MLTCHQSSWQRLREAVGAEHVSATEEHVVAAVVAAVVGAVKDVFRFRGWESVAGTSGGFHFHRYM